MSEWIADFSDADAPRAYLIRYDYQGDCRGWAHDDFSGVLDALWDAAYADAIGEFADVLTIYLLTDLGAVPVKVTQEAWDGESVLVTLTYREPGKRGKAAWVEADKGFRRRVEV